jgi:hypothetical protein
MNDQAFWGRRVFELGVGLKPIPQSKLTAEMLGRAIHRAITDGGVRRRAEELGEMIQAERGVVCAVKIIDERMRRSKPCAKHIAFSVRRPKQDLLPIRRPDGVGRSRLAAVVGDVGQMLAV